MATTRTYTHTVRHATTHTYTSTYADAAARWRTYTHMCAVVRVCASAAAPADVQAYRRAVLADLAAMAAADAQ